MSKTSKAKQLMTICLSVPLAAGAVFVAPTASANYAVVKVFDTPEVQYINVRNTADTSSNENISSILSVLAPSYGRCAGLVEAPSPARSLDSPQVPFGTEYQDIRLAWYHTLTSIQVATTPVTSSTKPEAEALVDSQEWRTGIFEQMMKQCGTSSKE